MAEEIKNEQTPEDELDAKDYIEAIKKIKANSVDRSEFEKLEGEKKELLNALIEGKQMENENQPKPVDVDALRKDLFTNENLTNLEYISKSLELRDAIIAQGGDDPFLPWGEKIAPTQEDVEAANRVAEGFKQCIEYANGDPDIFTNELQRITIDTPVNRMRSRR